MDFNPVVCHALLSVDLVLMENWIQPKVFLLGISPPWEPDPSDACYDDLEEDSISAQASLLLPDILPIEPLPLPVPRPTASQTPMPSSRWGPKQ